MSNLRTQNFSTNNTHKTTNFTEINYEKSDSYKYLTENQNKNYNSINNYESNQDILKQNDENNINSFSSSNQNNLFNYDSNKILINDHNSLDKKYNIKNDSEDLKEKINKNTFKTITEIEQKSFEKEKTLKNKNSFIITNTSIRPLEYGTNINNNNELQSKKGDLEEKINEIKIYLKTQLEQGSEKKEFFSSEKKSNCKEYFDTNNVNKYNINSIENKLFHKINKQIDFSRHKTNNTNLKSKN